MKAIRDDISFIIELESDIQLLDALIYEIQEYGEILTLQNTPEEYNINMFNYTSSAEAYIKHIKYLLPRLEDYMLMCKENNYPTAIGFYRVLRALRDMKL